MSTSLDLSTAAGPPRESQPKVSIVEGWTLREQSSASSTNLLAADLPAWSALRADTQTAGRGRFQRSWVSDEGGLWISAVVPTQPGDPVWRALPLAAGLAVCDALRATGVQRLRMRWPNDVLVENRKLAGLLLDQFVPSLAVVGLGVNVTNHPEVCDPNLKNQTTRLADLLPTPPALGNLAALVLHHLRQVVDTMRAGGFQELLPRINELWGGARAVELLLDSEVRRGLFTGVDVEGRLILTEESGTSAPYDAHQVRHLAEI